MNFSRDYILFEKRKRKVFEILEHLPYIYLKSLLIWGSLTLHVTQCSLIAIYINAYILKLFMYCTLFQMKEKLAEQDKQLETLKLSMKAKDVDIKTDSTDISRAAGELICNLWVSYSISHLN